jgi:hypothetical protein
MGVTIHFEGILRDEAAYSALLGQVREFSARQHWSVAELLEARRPLSRVRNEEAWDYVGLTRGIIVHPHDNSEPLRFEFDEKLYIQEYCKTQFAGPEIHMAIVNLLRLLQPLFEALNVEDEGEYWDTSDASGLSGHMKWVDAQIARLVSEKPSRRTAVRLPSLRIVDVIG